MENLKYETVLPKDFDGTFRFTNFSNDEFVGKWNSKEYHFPAKTTSPIFIPDQTPLEIQQIRKKFAKDLAVREFFKSQQYETLMKQERNVDNSPRLPGIHGAGTYSDDQLESLIQQCLTPLPVANAVVVEPHKMAMEDRLTKNEEGELNTTAIDKKLSLKKKALEA